MLMGCDQEHLRATVLLLQVERQLSCLSLKLTTAPGVKILPRGKSTVAI